MKTVTADTGKNLAPEADTWTPVYAPWRHGGWYVTNTRYPNGAVGCVSRNYPDRKWRIVCDPRPDGHSHTYPSRDAAARAERDLARTGFYVTTVNGSKTELLLGPYKTHAEAEANLERATTYVIDRYEHQGSWFWGYGTISGQVKPGRTLPVGKLNDVIGLHAAGEPAISDPRVGRPRLEAHDSDTSGTDTGRELASGVGR